jgi:hypothetical protein
MGRPKTKGKKLNTNDICERLGIQSSTWRTYQYKEIAPKPDGVISRVQGPFWYETTIDQWDADRRAGKPILSPEEEITKLELHNREAYDQVAEAIDLGLMIVNPECGFVYGTPLFVLNGFIGNVLDGTLDANGNHYRVLAHRVIWEWQTGSYVPLDEDIRVFHKDSIRHHNSIWNLDAAPADEVKLYDGEYGLLLG